LIQPKAYRSIALLSYQQQKVNPAQMSPDVEDDISNMVSTLTQIITSRTNLEKIIVETNLYQEERGSLPMEDVVELMRKNISIDPSKTGDTFFISFTGSNAGQVARVTNALASGFIEENLKYREQRASETSAYTQEELDMAKEMLDRKEAVMRDYKLKYYNEMPDQRADNMSRLSALQDQYQNRQNSIQDLERTRVMMQDQINIRKEMLTGNEQLLRALATNRQQEPQPESSREKLQRLKDQLETMLASYTEQHPQVKQLRKQIATLEQGMANEQGEEVAAPDTVADPANEQLDRILVDLELQTKEIGLRIMKLEKEKDDLQKLIEQYEAWVSAAPIREAEWSALTREYGELKRHYDFLVSQNLQARSALNLERTQRGSQFKIEDPARQSEKPVKPDFMKIMAIALFLGGGLGGGLALAMEMVDTSCRNPQDVENTFKLEMLCSVPRLSLSREVKKKRLVAVSVTLLYSCWAAGLIAAAVYFWQQGRIVV
jgi:polysaccharide chain length determinant protein (PEP-CTERM system associated)